MAKEGSTIGGLMDSIGTLTSIALQYGVPWKPSSVNSRISGSSRAAFTKNPGNPATLSITDYVFRWLALQFIPGYAKRLPAIGASRNSPCPVCSKTEKKRVNRPVRELQLAEDTDVLEMKEPGNGNGHHTPGAVPRGLNLSTTPSRTSNRTRPPCPNCGYVAVRNGACFKCLNCGDSLGCS